LVYKDSLSKDIFVLTEDDSIKNSGILPVA
jgi:hypothetical protein